MSSKLFITTCGLLLTAFLFPRPLWAQTSLLVSGDAGSTIAKLAGYGAGFSANGELGIQVAKFQLMAGGQMILGLPTPEDADADGYLLGARLGYVVGSGKGFELPITAGYMVGDLDLRRVHAAFVDLSPSLNSGYGFVFGPYLRGGYMWHNGYRSPFIGAGLRLTWKSDPLFKKKPQPIPSFY